MMQNQTCSVAGCENPAHTKTFCTTHYGRFRRHGDPLGGGPSRKDRSVNKQCRVDGCTNKYKGGQWCHTHYERFRKYGDPLAGGVFHQKLPEKCTADGCDKKPLARGMCSGHYSLFRKYGDHTKAKFKWHQNSRDQWHKTGHGYIWRYAPGDPNATANNYVYQHREVMAGMIGRALLPGENVHHINGNRADNRPENLELWVKSQPAGQRVKDLVAWAREILDTYEKISAA